MRSHVTIQVTVLLLIHDVSYAQTSMTSISEVTSKACNYGLSIVMQQSKPEMEVTYQPHSEIEFTYQPHSEIEATYQPHSEVKVTH